jgi:hypothetical protein
VGRPGADIFAYDQWREHGCEHVRGKLISYRIGNVALVGFLRQAVSETPELFPELLSKVLYDGTHGGDFLTVEQVRELNSEVDSLSGLHRRDPQEEMLLRTFEMQLRELVKASLAVSKPIVF